MKRFILGLVFAISTTVATVKADTIGTVSLTLPSSPIGNPAYVTPVGTTIADSTNLGPYSYNLSNPSNSAVASLLGMNSSNGNAVQIAGFCIALTTSITEGTPYSNVAVNSITNGQLGSLTATQTTNVLKLMADYIQAGGNISKPFASSATLNDALGSAIWEVIDGKGTDSPNPFVVNGGSNDIKVAAGSPSTLAAITAGVSMANTWLTGLSTQTMEEDPTDVYALVGKNASGNAIQTQSFAVSSHLVLVPEPQALVGLAGMGLMALAIGGGASLRKRSLNALGSNG